MRNGCVTVLGSVKDAALEMDSLFEEYMDDKAAWLAEVEWLEGVEEELLEADLMWDAAMYEASVDYYFEGEPDC